MLSLLPLPSNSLFIQSETKWLQIAMLILKFEIFGRLKDHGEKLPKLIQTSFSVVVDRYEFLPDIRYLSVALENGRLR